MKNAKELVLKFFLLELIGLSLPLFLFGVASFCGWYGILEGWIFGIFSILSCLLAAVFFGLRAGILCQKTWRVAVSNFALMLLCVGVFFCSSSFGRNPFENAFKMRLKCEYANHIPEIQKWTIATLKTAKQETYSIKESDWPSWIKIEHFPQPRVVISNNENMEGRASISIAWGSGMVGGWGLILGNPTLQFGDEKWADGVYFFRGQ